MAKHWIHWRGTSHSFALFSWWNIDFYRLLIEFEYECRKQKTIEENLSECNAITTDEQTIALVKFFHLRIAILFAMVDHFSSSLRQPWINILPQLNDFCWPMVKRYYRFFSSCDTLHHAYHALEIKLPKVLDKNLINAPLRFQQTPQIRLHVLFLLVLIHILFGYYWIY